jgi:hypothetical protein
VQSNKTWKSPLIQSFEVPPELLADKASQITITVTNMMSYAPGELYRGLQTEALQPDKFKKYACKIMCTLDLALTTKSSVQQHARLGGDVNVDGV